MRVRESTSPAKLPSSCLRCFLTLLSVASLLTSGVAGSWSSNELPNPQNDADDICGRKGIKSSICDPDAYLSKADADKIEGLINFVNKGENGFKQYPCEGGHSGPQIAVAIIDAMSPATGDKNRRAYRFAQDLHDQWGVGDANCQNGIILFYAIQDRAMGFSVGAGVNGVVTDAATSKIMAFIGGKMRKGDYGGAIVDTVTEIGNILSGEEAPTTNLSDSFWLLPLGAGMVIAFLTSFFGRSRSERRYNRLKSMLKKFDSDRNKANQRQFVATSCPICLEDFTVKKEVAGDAASSSSKTDGNLTGEAISESGTEATSATSSRKMGTETIVRTTTAGLGLKKGGIDKETETPVSKEAKSLPCGHKFHESCILEWVAGPSRTNTTCPICRQPIEERPGAPIEPQVNSSTPGGWDVYDDEYRFRMQRAHHYYPDFITWNVMNDWERNRHNTDLSMASSSMFRSVDPSAMAAASTSGSGGASYSFGGGSSGDGGGGGGGW